jgi:hypothetical protein
LIWLHQAVSLWERTEIQGYLWLFGLRMVCISLETLVVQWTLQVKQIWMLSKALFHLQQQDSKFLAKEEL